MLAFSRKHAVSVRTDKDMGCVHVVHCIVNLIFVNDRMVLDTPMVLYSVSVPLTQSQTTSVSISLQMPADTVLCFANINVV